jgi:hypothetical protein
MSMELRGGGPELVGEGKPLSLMQAFMRSAELVEARDGRYSDYSDWVWEQAVARERAEAQAAARERAEAAAGFTGSALAQAFAKAGREVSLIGIGKLNGTLPIWFPDAGDAHATLVDANRYALGASMVLAYDTEYQTGKEQNEILSYQVCAYEPRGRWCEFVIHVKKGDRLTRDEIIDVTRLHLRVKPQRLMKPGVLVVSHYGAAEWAALQDRKSLAGSLQLIRKVPVTLGWSETVLRINNRALTCKLRAMDTFLLAPDNAKGLKKLGDTVGIQKVDLPEGAIEDMASLRETDRKLFEEYGINDSRITLAYLIHMIDLVQRELGLDDLPLTVGGIATKAFVSSMSERDYLAAFGLEKRARYRKKAEIVPGLVREWADGAFRDGFCGGLNNAIPVRILVIDGRVVFDIDFVSAYPTAASTVPLLDWRNPERVQDTPDLRTVEGVNGARLTPVSLAYVRFRFPAGTSRPCIPVRAGKYGLVYPLSGEGYATTPELITAREKGAEIEILRCITIPMRANDAGLSQPLFAPFLEKMITRRRRFAKNTLANLLYKLICNGLYGKLAQGVKTRFVRSFDRRDQLPDSAVTCPAYACAITGTVRAALIELQDAIEEVGGIVHSATTDGCMASFQGHPDTHKSLEDIPGLLEAVYRKPAIQRMRDGLRNMGLPDTPLELKAVGDSCEVWKTRGYVIWRDGEVKHLAKASHQLGVDELCEVARAPDIQKWTMKSLASAQAIYDGKHEDLISVRQERRANLDFDFKLIPDGRGGYRPPQDLDEFLDWREQADVVRKSGRRATTEHVALSLGGHSLRGDAEATVRRKLLRALLQDIGGTRPPGLSDRDIAERFGFSAMDAKNAKRRPFSPLPDTTDIRAIIAEELHSAGFDTTPVAAFITPL